MALPGRVLVTAPLRIVVLRALMLGDMLCATPALRALRAGCPEVHLTLVGVPALRGWAERQPGIDVFIDFPGWPGLPELPEPSAGQLRAFVDGLRGGRYDLAVQLHGSGSIVNPLVAAFGARRNAGFHEPGGWFPPADAGRFRPWPAHGSEVERLLALTDHLGLPRQGTQLDWPLHEIDRARAQLLLPRGMPRRGYAIVHPGSQLPSRRWLPERFAAVADALAARGLALLITGTADEAALAQAVAGSMQHDAIVVAGRTDVWTLGALVDNAAVVVCNDTGISHIAAALGTPSTVVACGSDVARWAPAAAGLHRVFHHQLPCRPCSHRDCPYEQACARAVDAAPVAAAAVAAAGAAARPGAALV